MEQYKIIFSGPVGAGKTSAIKCISDIEVVSTEAKASDEVKKIKEKTTVAMDYGQVVLDETSKIHLYGTPGQARFDFMWEILSEGALGLVIIIDASAPKPLDDLHFYLDAFSSLINKTAVVIGLSRGDVNPQCTLKEFQLHLSKKNVSAAIFEVDARSKQDVQLLMQALLLSLDPGVEHAS
ncbi:MAG: ATP/GTP-binding protein [Sinobacterium sp.]|nr:ATP/GTP-binding protein [Sinobacterium sp.]